MKDSTTSPRSLGQRCRGQAHTHTPRWQGGNLLVQTVPWRGPGQPLQITLFCPRKPPLDSSHLWCAVTTTAHGPGTGTTSETQEKRKCCSKKKKKKEKSSLENRMFSSKRIIKKNTLQQLQHQQNVVRSVRMSK